MRTIEVTTVAITLDADGIALSQTPGGAGDLTLNGVGVVAGVATLDPPRRVTLTSAGATAQNFTVFGTDRVNAPLEELIAGPNANTVTTNAVFKTVTRVAAAGASGAALTVGWGAEHISRPILLGQQRGPWKATYQLDITGVVNIDVERTLINLPREKVKGDVWADASDIATGATADAFAEIVGPIAAIRIVQNSGAGSARLRVMPQL